MPIIHFLPSGKSISVNKGTELLEAANKVGMQIHAPCGANGTCGKCVVRIKEGEVDCSSESMLSPDSIRDGFIQACKSRVGEKDLTVEIPDNTERHGQFTDSELDFQRIEADRFPKDWELHPMVTFDLLTVPHPDRENNQSDLDRLTKAIQQQYGDQHVSCPLSVLRVLAEILRKKEGEVSLVLSHTADALKILEIKAGHQKRLLYGLAIDLGTTSISIRLNPLSGNENAVTSTDYNQQLVCGADIISRINYARQKNRLAELQQKAMDSINGLVEQTVSAKGIQPEQIFSAVVSGNTTMIHLLLGLNPDYIRLEPYTPTAFAFPNLSASELGLKINPDAPVYISPAVGSYVGGDILAGLLCTDLIDGEDEISMFLDIGTNGELAIGNRDFIMACACSAGPAFEGGGIADGMRAAKGAIESVVIDPSSGKAEVTTIGESKAKGICGSGIISLLANLYSGGWLDPSGKLDRSGSCQFIETNGRHGRYIIVPAEESAGGKAISISEAEIENVIRAKAAIYSACRLLMEQVGIEFDSINTFYIAGGFGRYLDLEHSITIGLLPDISRDKYRFLGNTSLIGSTMLLLSREFQSKQQKLADRVTYVDLSTDPGYMEQYTAALFLPHTDRSLFPSAT